MEVMKRSPVIVRVVNNSNLDYESGIRDIKLYVIAFVYDSEVSRETLMVVYEESVAKNF